jgi:hypothetical protein
MRFERPFCAPDPIFDLAKMKFLDEARKARALAVNPGLAG